HREQVPHRRGHAEASVLEQNPVADTEPDIDEQVDPAGIQRQRPDGPYRHQTQDQHGIEIALVAVPQAFLPIHRDCLTLLGHRSPPWSYKPYKNLLLLHSVPGSPLRT